LDYQQLVPTSEGRLMAVYAATKPNAGKSVTIKEIEMKCPLCGEMQTIRTSIFLYADVSEVGYEESPRDEVRIYFECGEGSRSGCGATIYLRDE
jgi:hypothetical protein